MLHNDSKYQEPTMCCKLHYLFIYLCCLRVVQTCFQSNIVVVMEKCWGTPVADRDNTLRYYMINDGCPVTGDSSMHIRGNGNSLQGRFDIKMFKFIGDDLNDVWLHCTVRACNATEADSCVPDCSEDGRKRRNAEDDEDFVPAAGKQLNYVSLDYTMIADLPIQDSFKIIFSSNSLGSILGRYKLFF